MGVVESWKDRSKRAGNAVIVADRGEALSDRSSLFATIVSAAQSIDDEACAARANTTATERTEIALAVASLYQIADLLRRDVKESTNGR